MAALLSRAEPTIDPLQGSSKHMLFSLSLSRQVYSENLFLLTKQYFFPVRVPPTGPVVILYNVWGRHFVPGTSLSKYDCVFLLKNRLRSLIFQISANFFYLHEHRSVHLSNLFLTHLFASSWAIALEPPSWSLGLGMFANKLPLSRILGCHGCGMASIPVFMFYCQIYWNQKKPQPINSISCVPHLLSYFE